MGKKKNKAQQIVMTQQEMQKLLDEKAKQKNQSIIYDQPQIQTKKQNPQQNINVSFQQHLMNLEQKQIENINEEFPNLLEDENPNKKKQTSSNQFKFKQIDKFGLEKELIPVFIPASAQDSIKKVNLQKQQKQASENTMIQVKNDQNIQIQYEDDLKNENDFKKTEKQPEQIQKIKILEEEKKADKQDDFEIHLTRQQKKDKKMQEKQEKINQQPAQIQQKKSKRTHQQITFLPLKNTNQKKQALDDEKQKQQKAAEMMQKNYEIMIKNKSQNGMMPMPQMPQMPMPQMPQMPMPYLYSQMPMPQLPFQQNQFIQMPSAPIPFQNVPKSPSISNSFQQHPISNYQQPNNTPIQQPMNLNQSKPFIPQIIQQAKNDQAKIEKKQIDFAEMMNQFEKNSINQKEERAKNDQIEYNYNEQNDYQVQEQAQNLLNNLQYDPNQVQNLFSQLQNMPQVQQTFKPQDLSMIQNLMSLLASNQQFNNHDYQVEYDDENPEGEDQEIIILSDDQNPKEVGKVLKVGTGYKVNPSELQNDDDIIDYFLENNKDWVICEYYLQGNCKYGDSCKYMHPESMRPDDPKFKGQFRAPGGNKKVQYEGDGECVICLEKVLQNGKRFGILENCSHCFCLECIRDWRATYDKKVKKTHYRTCPICRENSYLVIPSNRLIIDGEVKDQLIEEYIEALGELPCKHFNKGKGYCPFQNSCYYSHILENGEWYEYPFKQTYIDVDGVMHEVTDDNDQKTLADYIGHL